ncbi:MAG: hypothetical protein QXQ02_05720, partial [Halobacteria archaeon]
REQAKNVLRIENGLIAERERTQLMIKELEQRRLSEDAQATRELYGSIIGAISSLAIPIIGGVLGSGRKDSSVEDLLRSILPNIEISTGGGQASNLPGGTTTPAGGTTTPPGKPTTPPGGTTPPSGGEYSDFPSFAAPSISPRTAVMSAPQQQVAPPSQVAPPPTAPVIGQDLRSTHQQIRRDISSLNIDELSRLDWASAFNRVFNVLNLIPGAWDSIGGVGEVANVINRYRDMGAMDNPQLRREALAQVINIINRRTS